MIFKLRGLFGRAAAQHTLRIGYLPTLDAAPLLIAQARGLFKKQDLNVSLQRQTSWSRAAQKLAERELDAAHLPGTLPLATELGLTGVSAPLRTAFVLAQGGSSFSLSPDVLRTLQVGMSADAPPSVSGVMQALRTLVCERQACGAAKLRFVVGDLHDNSHYDLRYCLASAGIDPVADVQIVALTPGRLLRSLQSGKYDGAWVDEPYGSLAAAQGLLEPVFSKHAFWNHSQSKVLVVHDEFVRRRGALHKRLLKALLLAVTWADGHREEAVDLLSQKTALGVDPHALQGLVSGIDSLCGAHPEDINLSASVASFPWYSQAVWYLGQMIRWGDYREVLDFKKTAQAVYLPRVYREAARELDLPHPSIGYKNEGEHAQRWQLEEASQPIPMGPDLFFDGRVYKPRQTMKYLNGLEISHISAPLDAMWAIR